jgi:GDSL-like Lipase/Acylhydrolase
MAQERDHVMERLQIVINEGVGSKCMTAFLVSLSAFSFLMNSARSRSSRSRSQLPDCRGRRMYSPKDRAASPEGEEKRQAINEWIRSGEYDDLIDFDRALRDPSHPTRLLPLYDSGDHLHPNDAGTKAMGEAIPLRLFREG